MAKLLAYSRGHDVTSLEWSFKASSWAQGYKTFFMLNSAENEISSAYKKLNTINLNFFPA